MKINIKTKKENVFSSIFFLILVSLYITSMQQVVAQDDSSNDFIQIKGVVQDSNSKQTLEFASLVVQGTNISTITNTEGKFVLKVPRSKLDSNVIITYLGYSNKSIPLSNFSSSKFVIKLIEAVVKLPDVNLTSKDPIFIIRKVIENRRDNYVDDPLIMKAFYRESIKKRRTYASLSEAVIDIYKFPYKSQSNDQVKLTKARKSTDYRKIDTLVIKLQGGPYNNLSMDIIKNKDLIFSSNIFEVYQFTFDKLISINNRKVYVINFIQRNSVVEPYYQGKLYIDTQSFALVKAVYSLNLQNLQKASRFFVKKKPAKADVIPIRTNYIVDYRNNGGKWYFGYSRIELSFKINWNKKLFNSQYHLTIEMAVTDWEKNLSKVHLKNKEKLKTNVILNDRASGFANPEFWGKLNVIEPEKSIENAIKKIQRHLK